MLMMYGVPVCRYGELKYGLAMNVIHLPGNHPDRIAAVQQDEVQDKERGADGLRPLHNRHTHNGSAHFYTHSKDRASKDRAKCRH